MKTLTESPAQAQHTDLPWSVQGNEAPCSIHGNSSHGGRIGVATTGFNTGRSRGAADAAFIVEACNSHEALKMQVAGLVRALESIKERVESCAAMEMQPAVKDSLQAIYDYAKAGLAKPTT